MQTKCVFDTTNIDQFKKTSQKTPSKNIELKNISKESHLTYKSFTDGSKISPNESCFNENVDTVCMNIIFMAQRMWNHLVELETNQLGVCILVSFKKG
uniref:Uncharacterized protein n=1 Tax=Strongyloides papillosus TaxID=174720 RepID=A0A0N5BGM2_STREA